MSNGFYTLLIQHSNGQFTSIYHLALILFPLNPPFLSAISHLAMGTAGTDIRAVSQSQVTPGSLLIKVCCFARSSLISWNKHGSLNVPIEHHPTIRYMVYNGYYKVMSNISKMGHLPTPDKDSPIDSANDWMCHS